MNRVFQRVFKWMPIILFALLIMLDRDNLGHVIGYITLILSYSGILILRLLYDKKEWHKVFNKDKNILGMMPHPERMIDPFLSGEDGSLFFENLIGSV